MGLPPSSDVTSLSRVVESYFDAKFNSLGSRPSPRGMFGALRGATRAGRSFARSFASVESTAETVNGIPVNVFNPNGAHR